MQLTWACTALPIVVAFLHIALHNLADALQTMQASSKVISDLRSLAVSQRTVIKSLSLCASSQSLGFNCAWLIITGNQGNSTTAVSANSGPVEFLSCFDQTVARCPVQAPRDAYTIRSDCMACDACRFPGCSVDRLGCSVACECACSGDPPVATVPCHQLCDGKAQCPDSAVDESPEKCKLLPPPSASPGPPSNNAGASLGLVIAVALLGAALLTVGLAVAAYRRCRGRHHSDAGTPAVEWRRLSSGGAGAGIGGSGGEDGEGVDDVEASIPLGDQAESHDSVAA